MLETIKEHLDVAHRVAHSAAILVEESEAAAGRAAALIKELSAEELAKLKAWVLTLKGKRKEAAAVLVAMATATDAPPHESPR